MLTVGASISNRPPSSTPLSEPLALILNASSLLPPVRFSTPVNARALPAMAFSEPAPAPDSTHLLSASKPTSVSIPAPPPPAISTLIESAVVNVNTSSPLPPPIFSIATKLTKPLAAPAFKVPASVPVTAQIFGVGGRATGQGGTSGPINLSSPLPPSIVPLIEPAVASVKVSAPLRPVRFSMLSKRLMPVAEPAPAPLMVQAVAASGPISVSLPLPPWIFNETPAPSASAVKRSLPAPPKTVRSRTPLAASPNRNFVSTEALSRYVRSTMTPVAAFDTSSIPTTSSVPAKVAVYKPAALDTIGSADSSSRGSMASMSALRRKGGRASSVLRFPDERFLSFSNPSARIAPPKPLPDQTQHVNGVRSSAWKHDAFFIYSLFISGGGSDQFPKGLTCAKYGRSVTDMPEPMQLVPQS